MEVDPILIGLVLIGGIGLVIGLVVGLLLAALRSQGAKGAGRGSMDKSHVELLRVLRERRSKRLMIELGGKIYPTVMALSQAQRAGLRTLYQELQGWLETDAGREKPPREASEQPLLRETIPAPTSPLSKELALNRQSPLTPIIPTVPPLSGEALGREMHPPSLDVADILSEALGGGEVKAPPETAKSLVAQVNEILQRRLPTSPFAGRAIHLAELPNGEVVVWVDGQRFSGVGEVSDPDVRRFLQECVAEWEAGLGD